MVKEEKKKRKIIDNVDIEMQKCAQGGMRWRKRGKKGRSERERESADGQTRTHKEPWGLPRITYKKSEIVIVARGLFASKHLILLVVLVNTADRRGKTSVKDREKKDIVRVGKGSPIAQNTMKALGKYVSPKHTCGHPEAGYWRMQMNISSLSLSLFL